MKAGQGKEGEERRRGKCTEGKRGEDKALRGCKERKRMSGEKEERGRDGGKNSG